MDNNKEAQLEQVAERALRNAEQLNLAPPIFELYAALLSLSLAVLMFTLPDLLVGHGGLYGMMTGVMPQGGWALAFFIAGVTSALGMLFNKIAVRIGALTFLSVLYGAVTFMYGILLPNFGFILMFWLFIFTVASIPLTKYTGVWNKKEE